MRVPHGSTSISRAFKTEVVLDIEDDGRGGASVERGSGLEGLRDRLQALGGSLTLRSPLGEGTRLIATLPANPKD